MKITEYIKEHFLCLDGGMGTLLQERGLMPGELPERWCLTHPEIITESEGEGNLKKVVVSLRKEGQTAAKAAETQE